MTDLTTIIPAGKEVLLIDCLGEEKEIRISGGEIYLSGHETIPAPNWCVRSPERRGDQSRLAS
jgi:predicted RNA-binding protein